jgi:hypothetical protein
LRGAKRRSNPFPLLISALAVPLLLLSGCVYLRLLEVRNQLRDFDANFSLTGRHLLSINFKNPVLRDRDASFLIGAPPALVTPGEEADIWHYDFEAVRSSGPQNVPLETLTLDLRVKNGKLLSIVVPEKFLYYFSRSVVSECLRRAPDAEVLKMQKTVRASVRLSPSTDAELPSLDKTRILMGEPLEVRPDGDWQQQIYRYKLAGNRRPISIIARLSFDGQGVFRRAHITWETSSVDVTFLRD